jgi:hypothetical protein
MGNVSESQSTIRERFECLYRTLLTPVALIVTVSGAWYLNLAGLGMIGFTSEGYPVSIGGAVILLIASMFLYGFAYTDLKKYRENTSHLAFFFLIFSALMSSGGLIGNLVLLFLPPGMKTSLYWIAFLGYPVVGATLALWLCLSRLHIRFGP